MSPLLLAFVLLLPVVLLGALLVMHAVEAWLETSFWPTPLWHFHPFWTTPDGRDGEIMGSRETRRTPL